MGINLTGTPSKWLFLKLDMRNIRGHRQFTPKLMKHTFNYPQKLISNQKKKKKKEIQSNLVE
jgi:hypothetical protein